MKHIYNILFLVILINISGCKQDNKGIEFNYISKSIEKINVDPTYKWMVILPGLGCHGCIQEGEAFMQEYINNKDILFVLTKIESLKILQKKIGFKIKDHDNIYIDREKLFNIPTDNSIYPCIIELETKKIKHHEFQSPSNSMAFEKLKARI